MHHSGLRQVQLKQSADGRTDPSLAPVPADTATEWPDCCSSRCSARTHTPVIVQHHRLCTTNKTLYKQRVLSVGRPKFRPLTARTFFNRSFRNLQSRKIFGKGPHTQNLVDAGRWEVLWKERILAYSGSSFLVFLS